MRISSASSIVYGASLLSAVHGWVTPVSHSHKTSRSLRAAPLGADALGGVAEFDQWFADLDKATCQTCIQHHAFGSLRGLRCQDSNVGGNVLTVPKNVVLSSSYGDEDWDSQLAQKLWAECKRGQSSEFYGYVVCREKRFRKVAFVAVYNIVTHRSNLVTARCLLEENQSK
jgi:hypothetical protein